MTLRRSPAHTVGMSPAASPSSRRAHLTRFLTLGLVAALLGALAVITGPPVAAHANTKIPVHPSVKFAGKTQIGYGWGPYRITYPGDMNGDGNDDIVAANDKTGELWLYRTRDNGTLMPRIRIGGSGWSVMRITGADLNSDGKADIIAADRNNRLWVYPNRGDGRLGNRILIGDGGWNSIRQLVAVEHGPNGHPALYATDAAGNLRLYPSNGKNKLYRHTIIGRGGWGSIVELGNGALTSRQGRSNLIARDNTGLIRIYTPNASWTGMSRYVLGWGFGSYRNTGVATVNGTPRMVSISPGGLLYSWKAQYGSYSGYPPTSSTPTPPKPPESNAVFVYGTLMTGQPSNSRLSGDYSSKQRTSMSGLALYRMSGYSWPWAVVRSGYTSHGEVYWLKPSRAQAAIADLDRLEGYDPSKPTTNQSYVRVKRTMANGFTAWVYVAGPRTATWLQNSGSVIPSGDWLRR